MRKSYYIPAWKKAPFVRVLIPVIFGIIAQVHFGLTIQILLSACSTIAALLILLSFLPEAFRFRFRMAGGILLSLLLFFSGCFFTWNKDVRNNSNWYGKIKSEKNYLIASVAEPLEEKPKSFKAILKADEVVQNGQVIKTTGMFLAYFSKDGAQKLQYGDQIIVNKQLSKIPNPGNPAAFDYRQYCANHQLYQQVFLRENEWVLLSSKDKNLWASIIFSVRAKTVATLEKYLGKNDESAIAKALLIGYKLDLDKDLVQAYSNAGVVHIIAISGLHIGIIYSILFWLFSVLPFTKKSKAMRLLFIVAGLWFFSFVTGASPSVLRAALMFSFIILGTAFNKKGSVYNSIAASAFLLLCIDPFVLWDVGFQLSYLAVIGIVVAQKPISAWIYFKNKWLQKGWEIMAVSLAAQLFTLPLCLYYFHQLPLLFLLANLIAIPLSTLILFGCLFLIAVSPLHLLAFYMAKIVFVLLWLLNHSVVFFDTIPYSLWQGVSISRIETVLLYLFITCVVYAFIEKNKNAFKFSTALLLLFFILKTHREWNLYQQKKIIVFNIPQHRAIQFIERNNFYYAGDDEVVHDKLLNNYNLKPVRIALQLNDASAKPGQLFVKNNYFQFYSSRILLIDSSNCDFQSDEKIKIDYIIISKNPRIKITQIAKNFDCKNYIFDASNSLYKIEQWKKECEELHLHFHSVLEQGAFVINL
ncbi:MAG: ComEC/Rec2 family competence protein [Ginsengibacter sp.]